MDCAKFTHERNPCAWVSTEGYVSKRGDQDTENIWGFTRYFKVSGKWNEPPL